MGSSTDDEAVEQFEQFVAEVEPRLRRALVAAHGGERGRDATGEALAYAWEHWPRVRSMANPAGYLYRVGRSRAVRAAKHSGREPSWSTAPSTSGTPWVEPVLQVALRRLSERQRIAVVLIHGYQWTYREVAELTDASISTVQTHLERGLATLRHELGAPPSARRV
ncbi:MAG: RNA polymerase sigma factor [Acidimicrobiales bacterium]